MTSPKKILIVDDCVVVVKALSLFLGAQGYQVLTAEDGSGAISAVRREKPDLILLDINFPPDVAHGGSVNWDGYRIMNWLRRMDEAKGVPIIIISAEALARDRDRCRTHEVAGFFRKPFDNDQLLKAVRKVLDGNARPEPSAQESAGARKILFVDDENDWRYMATLYLTDAGYEVWTASNTAEALRQAERARPDLMIVDLNLGGESGLAVMKLLKAKYPGAPVLLYTGMDHDESAVQAMLHAGAHQYLRKTTMGEMLRAVQAVTGKSGERRGERGEREASALSALPSPLADPKSVLLLEDDAAFGESLQIFLECHGFRVTRVTNSAEALRRIATANFDIVICDTTMPSLAGGPSSVAPVQRVDQFYLTVERVKPQLCGRFVFMTESRIEPETEAFIGRVRGQKLGKPFPLMDLLVAIGGAGKRVPSANAVPFFST